MSQAKFKVEYTDTLAPLDIGTVATTPRVFVVRRIRNVKVAANEFCGGAANPILPGGNTVSGMAECLWGYNSNSYPIDSGESRRDSE